MGGIDPSVGAVIALTGVVAPQRRLERRLGACAHAGGVLDVGRMRAAARRWVDALCVRAGSVGRAARARSGGNRQKVALGRLLSQEADVLRLDEPTCGIDSAAGRSTRSSRAARRRGRARCSSARASPKLFGPCDRLAVLMRGRPSAACPIGEWAPDDVLAAAVGAPTAAGSAA